MQGPFGNWTLQRWPRSSDPSLQAWDAADELLLDHVARLSGENRLRADKVLLINDAHGALSTVLAHLSPTNWSDSWLSHRAAEENLKANLPGGSLHRLPSTEDPQGRLDLVLIRVPKSMALFEDQLARLRPHVDADSTIVAGCMLKHLPASSFALLERHLGKVSTSLASRKARLLFVEPDMSLPTRESPYPDQFVDKDTGLALLNHANVFSRAGLDHGARFLISHLQRLEPVERALDLGCGNGALGISLQLGMRSSHVSYVDESYSAVASARANHESCFPERSVSACFEVADALELHLDEAVDLVLCNPPFHQQHVLGKAIARGMFETSRRCLRQGGQLLVVANRHLDYPRDLNRLFGGCQTLATNRKFVILRSRKR